MNVFDHEQLFQQIGLDSGKQTLHADPSDREINRSSQSSAVMFPPQNELIAVNHSDLTLGAMLSTKSAKGPAYV